MAHPFATPIDVHTQTISVAQVNHLPIVADFARRLGLVDIVNRLVPVGMDVEAGTQQRFSALSVAAMERFALTTKHVHVDTTSVNVFGEYTNAGEEPAPLKITPLFRTPQPLAEYNDT